MIVLHADVRALRYCNRGAREFFERHGLDWSDFLRSGINAERLLEIGDYMADQVVEQARKRVEAGNGR